MRRLLESLGFEKRVKGSHHIFRKNGVAAKINLQRAGGQAKPYQVKQASALGKSDPLCCALHNGSFLVSAEEQARAAILEAKLGGE